MSIDHNNLYFFSLELKAICFKCLDTETLLSLLSNQSSDFLVGHKQYVLLFPCYY